MVSPEEFHRLNRLSNIVIGAAIEVHKELGPGLLESASVETIKPVNEVQLVTYLKLAKLRLGLLINFNVPVLRDGIRRKVNGFSEYTGIKPVRD